MSFVRLFWLRLTTRSSQENLNKLHSSSSILQWMSYSVYSTAGADRLENQTGYGTDLKATVTRASRPSLSYRLLWFISGIRYMNPVKYKSMVCNNKNSQYRVCPHCERCPLSGCWVSICLGVWSVFNKLTIIRTHTN